MNYLTHWLKLWPTPDKPTLIWTPESGVLWRNFYEPCRDHLVGLKLLCESQTPQNDWEGRARWVKYQENLSTYLSN